MSRMSLFTLQMAVSALAVVTLSAAPPAPSSTANDPTSARLTSEVRKKPEAAPQLLHEVVQSRSDGCAAVAPLTATAICALPQSATDRQIADVVYQAVKDCPDSVLDIVARAVAAAPPSAAPEIVAAAVSAVPDPWEIVALPEKRAPSDFKSVADSKSVTDYKGAPAGTYGTEREMPLLEAIVQTAWGAREGLQLDALAFAADCAIKLGLDRALAAIDDPRILFGVGDAGLTNYENEPRVGVSGGQPLPTPPPVSR